MMKSWKTTAAGALSALGVYISTVHNPTWMATVGTILTGLGAALTGFFARDNGVTSEDAGAK